MHAKTAPNTVVVAVVVAVVVDTSPSTNDCLAWRECVIEGGCCFWPAEGEGMRVGAAATPLAHTTRSAHAHADTALVVANTMLDTCVQNCVKVGGWVDDDAEL